MSWSTDWSGPGCNTTAPERLSILLLQSPPVALAAGGRPIRAPVTDMAAKGKSRPEGSGRGFYSRALDEAERFGLEEAAEVEGVDEEIALLRVKLRELLAEQPERMDLHLEAANMIARLVKTRYQITGEQKKSLRDAVQKVLTEIGVPLGVGVGMKIAGN